MDKQLLRQLGKRLNLTALDEQEEEYILTKEEEDARIDFEISALKKHAEWKLSEMKISEEEALKRIAETKWIEKVDVPKILAEANSLKHQELWHQENRRKEKEKREKDLKELKERCDATYMFKLMSYVSRTEYGKKLIVNDHNRHFITTLCYFFSEDPKFETELGYSLNKGLLIRGVSGVGKTHLPRCLENNELNPLTILSMVEISDEIKQNGEYEIVMVGKKMIYLDDVGTEEATVTHYGTRINFFKNFIELVYLKNKIFNKLIISTNNSFAEIEEKYGFRVRSRIKDMFNIIDVKGSDMRG